MKDLLYSIYWERTLLLLDITITLILVYASVYSRLYIDRYYSRITLVAYTMFGLAVLL